MRRWAWKEQYDIERPAGWTADGREWRMDRCEPLDPRRPVVHVSWFEADAFARAHDARLPTRGRVGEGGDLGPADGAALPQPWGETPRRDAIATHANVDQRAYGTVAVGTHPPAPPPPAASA